MTNLALERLAAQARRELDMLAYPAAPWVDAVRGPDGAEALDCAVIGAGQYGQTIAGALRREQIHRIALFDAAPEGREGPWVTFGRMTMLRTPKHLTGTELGLPSLSFRAWWEAQHGQEGWDALFRIPRTAWMDYLAWHRRTLDLPVRNEWRLTACVPDGDGALLRLAFETPEGPRTLFARNVVFATGANGAGAHPMPAAIRDALPEGRALHANDCWDPAMLRGERVGILGSGASAFDCAVVVLQAGAASAAVCVRRPEQPRANPRRWMETAGYLAHWMDLPDAVKWATMRRLGQIGQGPPLPTWQAAHAQPGFSLLTGTPWDEVTWNGEEVVVKSGARTLRFDRVILATGMRTTLGERPEHAAIAAVAARWRDRFEPPAGEEDARLGSAPYLDRHARFTEREPGTAPWLARVTSVMGGSALSLGPVATSNSGMKYIVPRVVEAVRQRLFLDQQEADWHRFLHGEHDELPREDAA